METQRALYKPTVLKVLVQLESGQFSRRVFATKLPGLFQLSRTYVSPIIQSDFEGLFGSRGFDPFERAVKQLA